MPDNPLTNDLKHILTRTEGLWEELRGQRLFIAGGTGFFGCWLLESFAWANDQLGLDASALVLTRNLEAFQRKAPHLAAHPAIHFHAGDVRSFEFPAGSFSHVIQAAVGDNAQLKENPWTMFDTIVQGTRHTLEFARQAGVKKFLFTSSGAVYGRQPPEITHLSEDYTGAPDPLDTQSTYGAAGEGKRAAETLCALAARQYGLEAKIARCFSFVGPYLPLGTKFAIGNFIHDSLHGRPICVNGDGTACRSYLYAADLAVWLWTILLRGEAGRPYNVGSEEAISIAELARLVAHTLAPAIEVQIAKPGIPGKLAERYVPATRRAQRALNLEVAIALPEAIRRTGEWYLPRLTS